MFIETKLNFSTSCKRNIFICFYKHTMICSKQYANVNNLILSYILLSNLKTFQ